MSDKERKPQITVNRKIAIKAIVTDQFKDYLRLELKETIRMTKKRIEEIEAHMKQGEKVASILPQLVNERQQLQYTLDQEETQKTAIEKLENGSFFSQGSLDGFVTVYEGDNLYEKIGGMEVIVKDGVISKISTLSIPTSS